MPAAKPARCQLRRGQPLAQALLGGWPAHEGSGPTLGDLSGQENHGTLTGGASWAAGQSGWCLSLDGSTGYVLVPAAAALQPQSVTLACWINPTLDASFRVVAFAARDTSQSNMAWGLRLLNDNTLSFSWSNSGLSNLIRSGAALAAGWHHAAGSYDAPSHTATLYLDGALVNSSTAGTGPLSYGASPLPLGLGCWYGATPASFFTGQMDAPAVYARALQAAEVAALAFDAFLPYRRRAWWRPGSVAGPYSVAAAALYGGGGAGLVYAGGASAGEVF